MHPAHITSPAQEPTVPGAQRDRGGMKLGKELHPPWVLLLPPLGRRVPVWDLYNEILAMTRSPAE